VSECDYYTTKILLLGNKGTGRTTLRRNHMQSGFDYKMTHGVALGVKSLTLKDGKNVRLQIWDLGDQERFRSLRKLYFAGALSTILLYDITNKESSNINNLDEWCQEIRTNAGDIPILLVGNKRDLPENREVSSEDALMLNEHFNLSGTLEISAKTGENVEEMFIQLSKLMLTE